MKSSALLKVLVILSCMTLLIPRASAQLDKSLNGEPVAPITLHNPKNLPWPSNVAQKIYFEACAATALELNPTHPKVLSPVITVELGADVNTVETDNVAGKPLQSTIRLKKWDEALFAYAVVSAARDTSIDQRAAEVIAHRVVVMVESAKTVQQERDEK